MEEAPTADAKLRRAKTDLFAEVLEQCKHSTAKTRVMYRVALSHPAITDLLDYLQKLEMIELNKETKRYTTTEKGIEYLKRYQQLQELLKS